METKEYFNSGHFGIRCIGEKQLNLELGIQNENKIYLASSKLSSSHMTMVYQQIFNNGRTNHI